MKTIVANLSANNQVTVRYVNRPNCLKPKQMGDKSVNIAEANIAEIYQKVENINKILSNAHIEKTYTKTKTYIQETIKPLSEYIGANTKEILHEEKTKYTTLELPDIIKYWDVDGEFPIEIHEKTCALIKRRKAALDIIKKSQQQKKRGRCWGKPQTQKSFTRNSKQKILECGAVIDKHIGSKNAYEVTLTIPGSGFDVFRVVSEWSGYLVNRLTQIIRRAEKKGIKTHWFFVWEHQKRGALHMHWCIACENSPVIANLLGLEIRAKWFSLLQELSGKTGIDLFRKKGMLGTWRNQPEKWQSSVSRVRKSVAAYFSKYCSKSYETSKYNQARRTIKEKVNQRNSNRVYSVRVISLCPSRYWGCGMRVKRLCANYRVTISFDVDDSRAGDIVCKTIRKWVSDLSSECKEVSRTFEQACSESGFIYARGYEYKIWFDAESLDSILQLFKRIRSDRLRLQDPVGALVSLSYF